MEINPEEHYSKKEANHLIKSEVGFNDILDIIPIMRGSTNIIYRIHTSHGNFILKISHRPDRIKGGVLKKEAKILRQHWQASYAIPIPQVTWEGTTTKGWPAMLLTELEGVRIEDIISPTINITKAAHKLGKFVGQWHQNTHHEIDEFETGRPTFPNFATYAEYWLKEWEPLLAKATHIHKEDIKIARQSINGHLHLFSEVQHSFVHADISKQNLLGKIENNALMLTGLCDFETVQTGPVEYDIATLHDALFLFYPEWEKPLLAGYESVSPLPKNFTQRLKVVNLFRSLRYIKRSVKYNETHYFDHDSKYFEQSLKNSVNLPN